MIPPDRTESTPQSAPDREAPASRPAGSARHARLSQALRQNLKRRKEQARGRRDGQPDQTTEPSGVSDT